MTGQYDNFFFFLSTETPKHFTVSDIENGELSVTSCACTAEVVNTENRENDQSQSRCLELQSAKMKM